MTVEVPDGSHWRPLVLMAASNQAVAMEASAENFQALFDLVQADLNRGGAKRPRPVGTAKQPRKTGDGKEYFCKGKWVKKIPLQARGSGPCSRKFRTLSRRPTEEDGMVEEASASGAALGRKRVQPKRSRIRTQQSTAESVADTDPFAF